MCNILKAPCSSPAQERCTFPLHEQNRLHCRAGAVSTVGYTIWGTANAIFDVFNLRCFSLYSWQVERCREVCTTSRGSLCKLRRVLDRLWWCALCPLWSVRTFAFDPRTTHPAVYGAVLSPLSRAARYHIGHSLLFSPKYVWSGIYIMFPYAAIFHLQRYVLYTVGFTS